MTLVAGVVGLAAVVVSLLRWLRVAQREHYIAGSCSTVSRRWLARRPLNILLAVVTDVALVTGIFTAWVASSASAVATVLAAAGAAAFPLPMTVLGSGSARLNLTRRARTLLAVDVALALVVMAVFAVAGVWWLGPAAAAVLLPVLTDVACAITAPLERRSADRFRTEAAAKLDQIGPTVIAVTGSWGKTSTKNHIKDLLTGSVEVVASPASWNNTAGLSRTINEHLTPGADVLVAEMGMYGPGEIRSLCSWVKPDIAVICAVGPMHLERVGSMDGVVAAKAEILERATTAVLWVDDPRLAALADGFTGGRVWRVGRFGTPDLDVAVSEEGRGADAVVVVHRDGRELGWFRRDTGLHAGNVGCAVAAVLAYGEDATALAPRIARLQNPAHRATAARSDTGVWVVDDTFNANPEGAGAALDALVAAVPDGRRAVVTPGMVELGDEQDPRNREFARAVAATGSTLVVVGWTNRRSLVEGAEGGALEVVASREQAREWVRANLGDGDGVLWENDLPDHYP